MDKLQAAAAKVAERAARLRPLARLRAALHSLVASDDAQRGQGLAEYALILALIAIVAILSLVFLGDAIVGAFEEIINAGFQEVMDLIGA